MEFEIGLEIRIFKGRDEGRGGYFNKKICMNKILDVGVCSIAIGTSDWLA